MSDKPVETVIRERLSILQNEVTSLLDRKVPTGEYNVSLRQLYSRIELLDLDIEEKKFHAKGGVELNESLAAEVVAKCEEMKKNLSLISIKRPWKWWSIIDFSYRFIGVCAGIVTAGVFCSLIIIVLRVIDTALELDPWNQMSEKLKRAVAWGFLELYGITVEVIGVPDRSTRHQKYFKEPCALLTFSHGSNLDGFLISSTCPVRHFALAKKELFLVPFFSWISLAFGGVPVDRGNRERAVGALQRASVAAKSSHCAIVIAPEGTRSKTGQLQSFKKGTFHIWEQLKVPIVPLIFYGAFELFPVGSWVSYTGKVYVRYLDPISPDEAADREAMMRLTRRRMLEAFAEPTGPIGMELTWPRRIGNILAIAAVLAFDITFFSYMLDMLLRKWQHSLWTVAWGTLAGVFAITAWLYVYNVYIVNWGTNSKKTA